MKADSEPWPCYWPCAAHNKGCECTLFPLTFQLLAGHFSCFIDGEAANLVLAAHVASAARRSFLWRCLDCRSMMSVSVLQLMAGGCQKLRETCWLSLWYHQHGGRSSDVALITEAWCQCQFYNWWLVAAGSCVTRAVCHPSAPRQLLGYLSSNIVCSCLLFIHLIVIWARAGSY